MRFGVLLGVIATLVFALYPADALIPRADGALAHLMVFVILTLVSLAAWPRAHWTIVGFALLGLGAVIELAQGVMTAGRTADISDLAFDAAAIAAGLIVGTLFRRFFSALPDLSR